MATPSESRARPPYAAYVLTLLACACVYFPRLGATGFSSTEGHRVIPAWEMLASRDFLVPRMFGQAYLRKPPGMPWAVALSSSIFGQTEFAARLVSAISVTLLCLLCAHAAHRWFAPSRPTSGIKHPTFRPALVAGLAAGLFPLYWSIGRSAEIEALNTLAAAGAVVCLLDLLLQSPERQRRGALLPASGATFFLTLALFAKGPAALPAVAAAIAAACITTRSLKPLARPALWLALAIPAALFALYAFKARAALDLSHETAILQGPSEFLWSTDSLSLSRLAKVAEMPFAALFTALPLAFFLIPSRRDAHTSPHAAALVLTCVMALLALTLLGVSNPRYAVPAFAFLPILAGHAALTRPRLFTPRSIAIAAALLAAGAAFYILSYEPRQRTTSGRNEGSRIGALLGRGEVVWADHLIEARPEVLLYAQRAARSQGRDFTVRWIPHLADPPRFPRAEEPGVCVALRSDAESGEVQAFEREGMLRSLKEVTRGTVHKFPFVLYRVFYTNDGPVPPGPLGRPAAPPAGG